MSSGFEITSLTGLDKLWVKARRNNGWFLTNKIASVLLAAGLAIKTASIKKDIMAYGNAYPDAENLNSYNFIYWLLFIYYSFCALDELIELYAVYFEREKGALGLLLEMNNFMGIGVIIYLTIFNYKESALMPEPEKYGHIKTWVNFQVIFMYIVLGLSVLMVLCMKSMQSKVTLAKAEEEKKKANKSD